jgi:hypothetical protein
MTSDKHPPELAWCDPETGRLCHVCAAEQLAEAEEFYREWRRDEKPLLDLERSLGMTRDEILKDAGRGGR